jgi:hypothetical protein
MHSRARALSKSIQKAIQAKWLERVQATTVQDHLEPTICRLAMTLAQGTNHEARWPNCVEYFGDDAGARVQLGGRDDNKMMMRALDYRLVLEMSTAKGTKCC